MVARVTCALQGFLRTRQALPLALHAPLDLFLTTQVLHWQAASATEDTVVQMEVLAMPALPAFTRTQQGLPLALLVL
jgi:hypothetical protein